MWAISSGALSLPDDALIDQGPMTPSGAARAAAALLNPGAVGPVRQLLDPGAVESALVLLDPGAVRTALMLLDPRVAGLLSAGLDVKLMLADMDTDAPAVLLAAECSAADAVCRSAGCVSTA